MVTVSLGHTCGSGLAGLGYSDLGGGCHEAAEKGQLGLRLHRSFFPHMSSPWSENTKRVKAPSQWSLHTDSPVWWLQGCWTSNMRPQDYSGTHSETERQRQKQRARAKLHLCL